MRMRKLAVATAAAALVVLGVAAPATASSTVTPTAVVVPNGTNPVAITATVTTGNSANAAGFSFAGITATATATSVSIASGSACGSTGITISWTASLSSITCNVTSAATWLNTSGMPTGTTLTFVFQPGSIQFASTGPWTLTESVASVPATVHTLTASTFFTATFDANGGSGTMAAQTASGATALAANSFTNSGYSFAGWNTAANGTGTSYSDGASFAFSASTTLYAQWTANSSGGSSSSSSSTGSGLANTGFNGVTYLPVVALLGALGLGALLLQARRRAQS